jgi:hypothetical protein
MQVKYPAGSSYTAQSKDLPPGTIRYCWEGHALDWDNMSDTEKLIHTMNDEQAGMRRTIQDHSSALLLLGMHSLGYHETPNQYDDRSAMACTRISCVEKLLRRDKP